MCGIIGIYSPLSPPTPGELERMNAEIVHRGPDDEGVHLDGPIGLGMRRLSIIDLAGGHQPIPNEDRSCWIVFNGEIYNYLDLQDDLRRRGHRFRSRGDTETILHLFEEVGLECVHALNGMFTFAIWDTRRRTLSIARDRLGIKPLYYYWNGSTLVFASEIKAILASGRVPRELNPEAVSHFLSFGYVPAPLTMWKGVHKLPPGHRLRLSAEQGTLEVERYWDIRYDDDPAPAALADDLRAFSDLFEDAVRKRLIADVPVGILLSGGLDSSAVAAAVARVHNAPLNTFSVAFGDGGEFSEFAFARAVAEHVGCRHHEVTIDYDDFVSFLPEFVWFTDEPLADPASIPLFYVSRLASEKVKVVLSGEGADEVLGGYHFNQAAAHWDRIARFQRWPRLLRETWPKAVFRRMGQRDLLERLERVNLPLAERNRRLLPYMTGEFMGEEKRALWPDTAALPDSRGVLRGYYDRARTGEPLHQLLYAYCQDWLVEDLLMKADRMTMANSIELRVPFLDYRLVEWLATRPADLKVRREGGQWTTKFLLREFARSRLPASILERPKQGFPVPLAPWMQGPLGRFARETLLSSESVVGGWFEKEALARIVESGTGAENAVAVHRLWPILVLELWARRWL